MISRPWLLLAVVSSCLLPFMEGSSSPSEADGSLAEDALQILERDCLACHGVARQGGLDLSQKQSLLQGGHRGPAAIPGNAGSSLLFLAASHDGELKMPPGGSPLAAADLEVLRRWIDGGLPWASVRDDGPSPPSWWSFRKLRRPAVPAADADGWVSNPIDAFVLARLQEKGLKPAPEADRRTLIRRAYFDLIGLPPTPEQMDRHLGDDSPDAYGRMVGELLESPRYGERWARHWLDVVRYADSSGYESDHYYPNAWRYRDYVIKSFNEDKPYDRFLQEQIAGDELWPQRFELLGSRTIPLKKNEYLEARVGTGLYTFGPEVLESMQDAVQLRAEELTDWADTTGAAFLGLTLGCARCHDHKADPISQRDYYAFQALFANSRKVDIPVMSPIQAVTRNIDYPAVIAVDESRSAYRRFEKQVKKRIEQEQKAKFPPEVVEAYETEKDRRTPEQEELAKLLMEAVRAVKFEEALTGPEKDEHEKLLIGLARAVLKVSEIEGSNLVRFEGLLELPTASVLGHYDPEASAPVHVLSRGEFRQKEERVGPGFPAVLSGETDPNGVFSGSMENRPRKQLALWLSRPDHPLTARVMVNRLWQWHLGRGLVRTPNDYGRQGEAPSHPQLLDWLAVEFTARNWSLKAMHWLILNSSTYRMSSLHGDPAALSLDPENRLLWRMNRRRLEAEVLWDATLTVAGTLNLGAYGRPAAPPLGDEEMASLGGPKGWLTAADPESQYRRGVYILSRRNLRFPMFDVFDSPQNAVSCPRRDVTTVAPQALWFLNNRMAFRQAVAFASRLVESEGDDPGAWVENAWRLALSRAPSPEEKKEALELMSARAREVKAESWSELPAELEKIPRPRAAALTQLCLGLFNLNEFSHID